MSQKTVQSVERALDILEYIANQNGAGVSEISRALNLNKSTAFGLIRTLVARHYLFKDEKTDTYYLTLRLSTLGNRDVLHQAVVGSARPYLEDLLAKYGETIHLVMATQQAVVYIDKLEGTKSIRVATKVGDSLPMHCTGVGKAILAFRTPSEIGDYIQKTRLPRYTPNTITEAEKLEEELSTVRQQGFAVDNEEIQTDVFCVAVPIPDYRGDVNYAFSISMPKFRATEPLVEQMTKDLLETAQKISVTF